MSETLDHNPLEESENSEVLITDEERAATGQAIENEYNEYLKNGIEFKDGVQVRHGIHDFARLKVADAIYDRLQKTVDASELAQSDSPAEGENSGSVRSCIKHITRSIDRDLFKTRPSEMRYDKPIDVMVGTLSSKIWDSMNDTDEGSEAVRLTGTEAALLAGSLPQLIDYHLYKLIKNPTQHDANLEAFGDALEFVDWLKDEYSIDCGVDLEAVTKELVYLFCATDVQERDRNAGYDELKEAEEASQTYLDAIGYVKDSIDAT